MSLVAHSLSRLPERAASCAADGVCGETAPALNHSATTGDAIASWRNEVIALVPNLRAYAWSLSRNRADADDLVQESLVKAWTHRDSFQMGTNLRAWLFTILRNTFYTTATCRRREVADEDGVYASRLTSQPAQDWNAQIGSLRALMRQLQDEHREALILVGAAGLSYEEAAEICGCAVGTVKSRVSRARAKLLRLMEHEPCENTFRPRSLRPAEIDLLQAGRARNPPDRERIESS